MLVKAGVDISRLNREIRRALSTINSIHLLEQYELIITSTCEGNHSAGSLHYANDAVDIRYPKKANKDKTVKKIRKLLGPDYDVVPEKDHRHIEYEP